MPLNPPFIAARRVLRRIVAAGLMVVGTVASARAQSAANVLLVINSNSEASQQVGDHYARARAIPQENILKIAVDQTEQINRDAYENQIEGPIARWLNRNSAQDRILYIVLTKGLPLRVFGTTGRTGTIASVDSELTLLYRKLLGLPVPPQGSIPNPYFHGEKAIADAKPFTHEAMDIYLVTRLDGYTVADVNGLIDRGQAPVRTGRIALDEKSSLLPDPGNRWLERAAQVLKGLPSFADRVVLEPTSQVIANQTDLLGYFSWGSNDPAITTRDQKLGFVPGALAAMFVSTDARTFKEPPAQWTLGKWTDAKTYFESSPQSLTGDLIRAGVTGTAGHVAEPYLDATIRPDVLFPAYVSGFNLAESFYLSIPALSWQTVVVGDPLAAPFRTRVLSAQDIDRGKDPATEYPAFFSARVLKAAKPGIPVEAAKFLARAYGRLGRDDKAGARQAFEQATVLDPSLVEAHLRIGMLLDEVEEWEPAIARYRRVLALVPNQVVALNNLAYDLSMHQTGALPEALQLAQRAMAQARTDPGVADTLAWILHLMGDHVEARRISAIAVRGAPDHANIQLRAAMIDAAAGAYEASARELARAVALDPSLNDQADVQQLKAKLEQAGKQ